MPEVREVEKPADEHVVKWKGRASRYHPHRAECSCGWSGANHARARDAEADARRHKADTSSCPKCGAAPGADCVRRDGHVHMGHHKERGA